MGRGRTLALAGAGAGLRHPRPLLQWGCGPLQVSRAAVGAWAGLAAAAAAQARRSVVAPPPADRRCDFSLRHWHYG